MKCSTDKKKSGYEDFKKRLWLSQEKCVQRIFTPRGSFQIDFKEKGRFPFFEFLICKSISNVYSWNMNSWSNLGVSVLLPNSRLNFFNRSPAPAPTFRQIWLRLWLRTFANFGAGSDKIGRSKQLWLRNSGSYVCICRILFISSFLRVCMCMFSTVCMSIIYIYTYIYTVCFFHWVKSIC